MTPSLGVGGSQLSTLSDAPSSPKTALSDAAKHRRERCKCLTGNGVFAVIVGFPDLARVMNQATRSISRRAHMAMKRTYQPSKVRRARTHGFLVRMKTRGGRAIINARRAKGRKRLAV